MPISAYDLATRAASAGEPILPNQIYRTLRRLMDHGLVHRIEMLSAYILKREPFDTCLICDQCGSIRLLSLPELAAEFEACATARGFIARSVVLEATGRCPDCRDGQPGRAEVRR